MEKTGYGTASVEKLEHFFSDCGEIASQNRRTARLEEIDVLIAVTVIQICAFGFFHTHREGEVECEVVLDTARNIFLCLCGNLFGFCTLGIEVFQNLFEIFLRHTINRLVCQILQFFIDLLCVFPFGNAVAVCHNLPPKSCIFITKIISNPAHVVNTKSK